MEKKELSIFTTVLRVKLGKHVADNDDTNHSDIFTLNLDGFQYLDTVLQFFSTSEGYVSVTGTNYNHVFNYTEHLGNIRLSYTKDPVTVGLKILEQSHYYPYGMKHSNYNDSKHDYGLEEGGIFAITKPVIRSNYQNKYNGKEYQDELGLNLYDMDFRDFDPAIARWMNIDPLAEKRYELNPYNYVQNSPLFRFDPDGLTDFTLDKKTGEVKEVKITSDKMDRVLKTNSKGEVKKKGEGFLGFLVSKSEKGKEKVAFGGVEKGILKDGQKLKNTGAAYKIGGDGNPTQVGVESFVTKLSTYLGLEVGGTYASENNSGSITHMTIGKCDKNKSDGIVSVLGERLLTDFYNVNQNPTSLMGHFHVHPNGNTNSSPKDDKSKIKWQDLYKSSIFNILIPSTNTSGYEKVPY